MSFGIGIGDVIALLQLVERIAHEVRNYRDAPQHFQQLCLELNLMQRTLKRVLQFALMDTDQSQELENIRAVAIFCNQMLVAFLDRMRSNPTPSVGLAPSSRTLGTFRQRLRWCLITKKDVDDLMKVLLHGMTIINTELGLQQLSTLQDLNVSVQSSNTRTKSEFAYKSSQLLADSKSTLETFRMDSLAQLSAIHAEVLSQGVTKKQAISCIDGNLEAIAACSGKMIKANNQITPALKKVKGIMLQTLSAIMSIAADVRLILLLLQKLSRRILKGFTTNMQTLLDIHAMMKHIIRAIEAIPLHLTLPIIRFDDAWGQSWALPYQACHNLESFENIWKAMILPSHSQWEIHPDNPFCEGFSGLSDLRSYLGLKWEEKVKEGVHLRHVLIEKIPPKSETTPFSAIAMACVFLNDPSWRLHHDLYLRYLILKDTIHDAFSDDGKTLNGQLVETMTLCRLR